MTEKTKYSLHPDQLIINPNHLHGRLSCSSVANTRMLSAIKARYSKNPAGA